MKHILQIVAAFILLPVLGLGALLLCSFLPVEPIREHALMSMPKSVGGASDNDDLWNACTDAIMVNIATSNTGAGALQYSLTNVYNRTGDDVSGTVLLPVLQGDFQGTYPSSYARYWHGYLLMLRPLMSVMTYDSIRVLNTIVIQLLFIVLIALIWKRLGGKIACCFFVGFLMVAAPIVTRSFQTTDIFAITYSASIAVLLLYGKYLTKLSSQGWFFYCIGCATSYFDFLTAPILTLGIPLLLLMLMYGEECGEKRLKAVLVLILAWGGGYAWMWASKWILTDLFTPESVFASISEHVHTRSVGHGDIGEVCRGIWQKFSYIIIAGAGAVGAGVAHLLLSVKSIKSLRSDLWLVLIILLPVGWTFAVMEHTIVHKGMTWRIYAVTIIGWMIFLLRNSSLTVLMERLRLKKH